jgi:hypothetical protein
MLRTTLTSIPALVISAGVTAAAPVSPVSYSMQNGETGSYT